MDISCDKCQARFKIPDEKIPRGQVFSLPCPKCRQKITVDPAAGSAPTGAGAGKSLLDQVDADAYDAAEKPFDFVEEGVETALLCEPDPANRSRMRQALDALGYHTTEPKSPIDALKKMRFHVFDVIVLNEMFGTSNPDENNILRFLDRLSMDVRRNIFVALVTDRFRTFDNMAAFHKSVNITISSSNIDDIQKILKRGVADNAAFYRVFKEALIKTGRM